MHSDTRRSTFLRASGTAVASFAVVRAPAKAAQFTFKLGHSGPVNEPSHVWAVQMAKAIKDQTGGRLEIQVFPNATLGSQTSLLSQVRLGSIQMVMLGNGTYSGLVPVSQIDNVGFAFSSAQLAQSALDGPLGAYVRKEFAAKGLHAFEKVCDYGTRQITSSTRPIRTVADFAGFKLRISPSALVIDQFKTLGATPVPVDSNEMYSGLQTHLIDGQDSSLSVIETFRLYEVQTYLSITNGSWSGYWLMANGDAWNALPADIQAIFERNAAKYALLERADSRTLNASLGDKLRRQGMTVNKADSASMRAQLAPYYARWKAAFGPTVWGLLEERVGKLG